MPQIGLAGVDAGCLCRIDIETDDPKPRRPSGSGERHAYIPQPDYTDDGFLARIQLVHWEPVLAVDEFRRG